MFATWRRSNRHRNHGLSFDGEIEFEAEARINGTGDDIDEPADRHPRLQMPDR
jgi:predicted pyridoxine 5'-phosphate oxidase superfamily flavin-nucleotide-binding protein